MKTTSEMLSLFLFCMKKKTLSLLFFGFHLRWPSFARLSSDSTMTALPFVWQKPEKTANGGSEQKTDITLDVKAKFVILTFPQKADSCTKKKKHHLALERSRHSFFVSGPLKYTALFTLYVFQFLCVCVMSFSKSYSTTVHTSMNFMNQNSVYLIESVKCEEKRDAKKIR